MKKQILVSRSLQLSVAVMLACASMAQAQTTNKAMVGDKNIPFSPFAFLSLNLQSSNSASGNFDIPPRVMIMFDDSGSMGDPVRGSSVSYRCLANKDYPYIYPVQYRNSGRKNNGVVSDMACFVCKDGSEPKFIDTHKGWWLWQKKDPMVMDPNTGIIKPNSAIQCGNKKYTAGQNLYDKSNTDIIVSAYVATAWPEINSKMGVAREALTQVVDTYKDQFLWGLISLWGTEKQPAGGLLATASTTERANPFMGKGRAKNYQDFKSLISRLRPSGGTPSTTRYLQVADYLLSTKEYICQNDYIVIFSDGDSFGEVSNENDRTNIFPKYKHSNFYGALPQGYNISGQGEKDGIAFFSRVLDGRARGAVTQGDVKSSAMRGISVLETHAPDKSNLFAGNDKDNTHWDGFEYGGVTYFKNQLIKTYSIGFGSGLSASGKKYLQNAATNNTVYNASDVEGVKTAFKAILDDIQKDVQQGKPEFETSFTPSSPAIAGAGTQKLDSLAAQLTLNPEIWSSEFQFLKLDNKTGLPTQETVSADYDNNRNVIISYIDEKNQQQYKSLTTNSRDLSNIFGFSSTQQAEFTEAFLPWYLRSATLTDEQIENNAQKIKSDRRVRAYRERAKTSNAPARMMADVMGAPVVGLGYEAGRPKYMMTAANDGMVYLFSNTGTASKPYQLKMNYLPASMQRESTNFDDTVAKAAVATAEHGYGRTLTAETATEKSQPHLFLNNGGIQWRQTSKDAKGNTATYVAGAMGQGGRGAYVLAISGNDRDDARVLGLDSTDLLRDVPMWETEKGENNKLGYTVSTPQFAQVATTLGTDNTKIKTSGIRQLLFLANGYNAPDKVRTPPTLYVYDALGQDMGREASAIKDKDSKEKGQLVTSIEVSGGGGGLSTPTLVDIDADNLADVAYAGDQNGNLYRFDLRGKPNDWKAHKIYQGEMKTVGTLTAPSQPITAAPAVFKIDNDNYMVIVGTGSDIYQSDLGNKDQQVVLGIHDNLSDLSPKPLKQSDLVEQSILTATGKGPKGEVIRYLTKNQVPDNKGWVLKLGPNGERVVTQAGIINKTAFFTARVYDAKTSRNNAAANSPNPYTCKINSSSTTTSSTGWLYAVDVKTGSNPKKDSAYFKMLFSNQDGEQAAAQEVEGLSSSAVISSLSELENVQAAVNANGAFGSGQDLDIDASQGRNDCVNYDDYTVGVVSSKTGYSNFQIEAFRCPAKGGRLIRINSRQIFE